MPELSKFDLDFPRRYELLGELRIPYQWTKETVRIWKPTDGHDASAHDNNASVERPARP